MKIKKITRVEDSECQCISVSAKDEMYVTKDKILTHNTFIYTAMTEISWWERSHWTRDAIYTFFSKAYQRVVNRMKGHYIGRVVIDSSPFSLESPIDKFVYEQAVFDPKWYCITGSRWSWFPGEFPGQLNGDLEALKDFNLCFPLYKGGQESAPKVIESEMDLANYDPLDIIWSPRKQVTSNGVNNFQSTAKVNAIEFLRDYAGYPAGASDRIFTDGNELNRVFDNDLKSIYTSITADYMLPPEGLIWNKIKDVFFYKLGNEYMFYRNPMAARVLSVDQSTTGDATAISVAHREFLQEGEGPEKRMIPVTINDFTIMIIPKDGKVSLDAIRYFILDLIEIGHLNIKYVNFDKFQSDATVQDLQRKHIPTVYVSADKNNEPYTMLIEAIRYNRFASGKNIFLKNNLRSLHISQRDSGSWKYDHFNGKICNSSDNTDWATSELGINAKDGSDTLAECHFILETHSSEFAPNQEFVPFRSVTKELEKNLQEMGLTMV